MPKFLRINNILIDPGKVIYLQQDEKDPNVVVMMFDNGKSVDFIGAEAAEVWRHFDDDRGWRGEEES